MIARGRDSHLVRQERAWFQPEANAIRSVELASSNEDSISKTRAKEPQHLLAAPRVSGKYAVRRVVEIEQSAIRPPKEDRIRRPGPVSLADAV